jgi:transcriptional regulator with XRE-family HTH domain
MDRFGEKLQRLRTSRNLTQRVLANRFGYRTHSQLAMVESGTRKPSVELVLKVARFFNVSTDVLLKDELELDDSG